MPQTIKKKRCPNGQHRNPKTSNCEPVIKKNSKSNNSGKNKVRFTIKRKKSSSTSKINNSKPKKSSSTSKNTPKKIKLINKKCIFSTASRECLKVGKHPEARTATGTGYQIYYCDKHKDALCYIIPNSKEKGYPKGIADCTTPGGGTWFLKVL